LVAEREQVWTSHDHAQGLAEEFRKLCSFVPNVAPAKLQLPGTPAHPPAQVEATIQQIKQELAAVEKLNAEVTSCNEEIESIKRKEKMLIGLIVGGVVVVLFIFLIVIVVTVSNLSST
jgi:hypothetical protein